jgi:tagaturonate epimerase
MHIPKYSLGVGDRFAHQGTAQLDAVIRAQAAGVVIAPVWNKSNREHTIVGTEPASVRAEADAAVRARGWTEPYFVDADHIGLKTVDRFIGPSDFFTLDVAESIGAAPAPERLADFVRRQGRFVGRLAIPGIDRPLEITRETVEAAGRKFLAAVEEAGRIYRRVAKAKAADGFVTEVSMDETDTAQTPLELLLILAAIAEQQIPVQTIAPRFTGRFNKGVDYVGDVERFSQEFREDLAVIRFAVGHFGLPRELKLSVHSGSDKFSIYGPMRKALVEFDAGVHLKTAGTTWLEELIGLAMAGGDGLAIAKEVYAAAAARFDELCAPYASVVDIRREALPSPAVVAGWDGPTLAAALRHDQQCPSYDPNLRQLLHVGYKVAAEMGGRYTGALEKHAAVIAQNVTENLYQRHIRPLFLGE